MSDFGYLFFSEEKATIPISYSRIIGRILGLQIRDLPQLLKFTVISVDTFLHDDIYITQQAQVQILRNASMLSNDSYLGLKIGRALSSSTHGAMGFLINSSPNLMAALEAAQHFMPTRMSLIDLKIHKSSSFVECLINFDSCVESDLSVMLSEIITGIFFEHAEFLTGKMLEEVEINFQHPKPNYPYHDYLAGHHQFSQSNFNIRIPQYICQIPNSCASHQSYLLANHECEKLLNQLNSHKTSTTYQVQKLLLSERLGDMNEKDIASSLFISKRTLHRQLQKENTSFKEIRKNLLSKQAAMYLSNSNISIDAIAALLGYHDASNFRRAFRSWFNTTPHDYRKNSNSGSN
ncbi:AraC family transcriptional regulator [Acinetobacter sp. ANC 4805]|uniref:AraC family transcriptional regulator n=1 Tax=Acinetobacter sp. ANC 4805 TaxID=2923425 RepID=UPI001F4A79FE|nr:AraC family transcriptional regulator [Acinetobacter sp. ANC 4805]MCH7312146.1 AraC family transcriptional regulator [Acinetobacter sp. ANC 4805]